MRRLARLLPPLFGLFAFPLALSTGGCGGGTDDTSSSSASTGEVKTTGPAASAGKKTTTHPGATPLPGQDSCEVVEITDLPEDSFNHIADCQAITYATDPPSGGDHWPFWAAYKEYTHAVPKEMYVHNLEHGSIVLLYKCDGECPDVVAALDKVFNSKADPLCLTIPGGPHARMVLTPDPTLKTPIAMAAWGSIYTATCIDQKSLQAFADKFYGGGREQLCNDGEDIEAGFVPCQ